MQDPYYDRAMKGWIIKTARENLWRCAAYCDLDDLIQDGLLCFHRCRVRYKQFDCADPTPGQRRHFMALVKTTYLNHLHSLAQRRSEEVPASSLEADSWDAATAIAELPEGPLRLLILQAPQEILDALRVLATDTSAYLRKRVGRHRVRETTNQRLSRLLGLDDPDLAVQITKYFGP